MHKPKLVDPVLTRKKKVLTEYESFKERGKTISTTINIIVGVFLVLFGAWLYDIYIDRSSERKTSSEELRHNPRYPIYDNMPVQTAVASNIVEQTKGFTSF